jgi:YhcH/YjgK/YiaL family protein
MIADSLTALPQYLPKRLYQAVMPFIEKLDTDIPDGKYPLDGRKVFARIQTYETKPVSGCRIEAHRKYADIQIVLAGSECIDVFPAVALEPETDYDAEADVQFYKADFCKAGGAANLPVLSPLVRFSAVPDYFALFYPQDAHRPQMHAEQKHTTQGQQVRKLIIKINVSAYFP